MKYSFIHTYKPVLDDAAYRVAGAVDFSDFFPGAPQPLDAAGQRLVDDRGRPPRLTYDGVRRPGILPQISS